MVPHSPQGTCHGNGAERHFHPKSQHCSPADSPFSTVETLMFPNAACVHYKSTELRTILQAGEQRATMGILSTVTILPRLIPAVRVEDDRRERYSRS
ncbi:hypothetical protein HPP92_027675 [Vanilla planifolia]|uniref:Uncharacterized protein n=1 Tax=Vanilla planifolia TaxID=51239 RepID=A0A835PC08_VANPL|nr:hypothetical protein HPP92_027675 [Vanilla planifolia]